MRDKDEKTVDHINPKQFIKVKKEIIQVEILPEQSIENGINNNNNGLSQIKVNGNKNIIPAAKISKNKNIVTVHLV